MILILLTITGSSGFLYNPRSPVNKNPPKALAKSFQYSASSENLVVGTDEQVNSGAAAAAEGINTGSWKATLGNDNFHWIVDSVTPATPNLDAQLNIDGIMLQNANKFIINTAIDIDSATLATRIQICDWSSTTSVDAAADAQCTGGGWRTLNSKDASNNSIDYTNTVNTTQLNFQIYNGYWSTGTTGGTAINTPLSNFINGSGRVKIRYWSDGDVASNIAIDYLRLTVLIDPIYEAASFTQITGGTPAGTYANTVAIGNTAAGQMTSTSGDDIRLSVPGTAGSISDFYLSYKDVRTYTGANTIYVKADQGCDNTGINYTPKIYNFNTPGWENLSSAAIACAVADTTNEWAKNNVTISNYISGGEIRVGWFGSGNSTINLRVDLAWVMIGTTNSDTAKCEITFGSGTATDCTNTRDLDSNGTTTNFANTAADESNTYGNDFYAYDHDADGTVEEATAANIGFSVTLPSNAEVAVTHYAGRFAAGTSGTAPSLTVQMGLRDYTGFNQDVSNIKEGGWDPVGTTSANNTLISTDTVSTFGTSGWGTLRDNSGSSIHSEYLVDTVNNQMNLRLRTTVSGNATNNSVTNWDFAMVSVSWVEDSSHPTIQSSFSPTSKTLATGTETSRQSATAYSASAGVNGGGWQSTLTWDGLSWVIAGANVGAGATNYDAQLNLKDVRLNGANSILISTDVITNANIGLLFQICDWVSTTNVDNALDGNCTGGGWRTINTKDASNAALSFTATSATGSQFLWRIYDGYWSTGTTGGTPISTPLTNFIDATKGVKIRFFSTTQSATNLGIDFLHVRPEIMSTYTPASFTQITGGTPTGTYVNANSPIGNTASAGSISRTTNDGIRLQVPGTAGSISDFYFSYKNIKTFTGANTIAVRSDYSCSTTGINLTPKIYNFSSAAWENLTTGTIACSATDANGLWAKNNVNLVDYIAGGEARIGFFGSANSTVAIRIDGLYINIGATNTDSSQCEISFGTGTATDCTNTRDLDSTGTTNTFNNVAENESTTMGTGEANSYYAFDNDNNATLGEATASEITFAASLPANTSLTNTSFVANYQGCGFTGVACGATALTASPGSRYYSGYDNTTNNGGWTGTPGGSTSTNAMTYWDLDFSQTLTGLDFVYLYAPHYSGQAFTDDYSGKMSVRLRSSTAGTASTGVTTSWDFAMVTLEWVEIGSTISVSGTSSVNGATVAVAVDGVLSVGHTATVGGGTWTISNVWVRNGSIVVVWHDGASTANQSTGVTTYDGSGNITGMDLTAHVLSVGSADNQTTTLPNMGLYDNRADAEIMYKFTSSTLAVDAASSYTDEKLDVLSGNTLTVASTETITTLDLTVDGTLSGTGNVTATGSVVGTGTITFTAGTFLQQVSSGKNFGTTGGSNNWSFFDLTFSDSHASNAITITTQTGGSGTITVADILRVGKSGDTPATTLDAGNRTWTFTLGGASPNPFQLLASPAGVLTGNASTFNFTDVPSSGSTTVQGSTGYYNVTVNSNGKTFVLGGAITLGNTLNIGNGTTLDTTGTNYAISIGGSYANSGTFTANSSNVTFTATSGTKTLTGTLNGSSAFYDLTFNGSGGTWTLGSASTVTHNLAISAGTVDDTGNQVTGNGTGTFTMAANTTLKLGAGTATVFPSSFTAGNTTLNAASTVIYNATVNQNISGTPTYGNLQLSRASGTPTKTLLAAVVVAGSLIIDASNTLDVDGAGNFGVTLAGSYTNNGTFTARNGTVTLNGTTTQTLAGTMTTTSAFYDLMITNSSGSATGCATAFTAGIAFSDSATISHTYTIATTGLGAGVYVQYGSGKTYAVSGISWVGTNTKGIYFRNSNLSGGTWLLNYTPGSQSVSYVNVGRSDASGGTQINASNGTNTDCLNNVNWLFDTAPNSPTSLAQKKTDDTVLATGDWTNETSVKFTATATDADNPDTLYLCVEKEPLGTAFSNIEDSCGLGVAYSGLAVAVTVTIGSLIDTTQYHWQARIKDAAGLYSAWTSYGGNAESARDFGIDTTAPSGPTSLTSTSHSLVSWNSGSVITVIWTAASDGQSGLSGYSYTFDTSPTTTPGANQNLGAVTTVNSSALTDNVWYFHIRPVDNLGNWGTAVHLGPFYIDTTKPTTPGTPTTTSPTTTNTPTWTWTASTDVLSGLALTPYLVKWSTDPTFQTNYFNGIALTNTFTHTIGLAAGTWYFQVTAIDLAGNQSITANGTVVIQLTGSTSSNVITLPNIINQLPQIIAPIRPGIVTNAGGITTCFLGGPAIDPNIPLVFQCDWALLPREIVSQTVYTHLPSQGVTLPGAIGKLSAFSALPTKWTRLTGGAVQHFVVASLVPDNWASLPGDALRQFVLAPLPTQLAFLLQKFPDLSTTFNTLGISHVADLNRLNSAKLVLPGISKIKDTPAGVPTGVVFASNPSQTIDLNINLTLDSNGQPNQQISAVAGNKIKLTVRPDHPVAHIKGYLVFKSKTPPTSLNLLEDFTLSRLFASPVFAQTQVAPPPVEKGLVLVEFEYSPDPSGNGLYSAEVTAPQVDGQYQLLTVMDYQDPSLPSKEIKLLTVIDPEGYIYEKVNGKETRLPNTTVSLFWLNPQTNQYELWPGNQYQQENPQTTDETGRYSFLAPVGNYYITATANGYQPYKGDVFELSKDAGIHTNIQMEPKFSVSRIDWKTVIIVLLGALVVYGLYTRRKRTV